MADLLMKMPIPYEPKKKTFIVVIYRLSLNEEIDQLPNGMCSTLSHTYLKPLYWLR